MKILNALQVKKGAKTEHNRMYSISQPLQFLPKDEKDEDWAAWNMDWLEWNGLKHIRRNARRLMKNYKLAEGIIDKSDYLVEEDNDMRDFVETLAEETLPGALELKFYPIIPNVVNTMVAEFAKRNKRISFRAVDEFTFNEVLENKRAQVENVLVKRAEQQLLAKMIQQGANPEDPDIAKKLAEQTSIENLKTLPEIQDFFTKDYEVLVEKWASRQHQMDEERFGMDELEERAFRDSLITDREFWHFDMLEDDYNIELWNPVLTFYHKSPDQRYISNGNFVGKIEMMTPSDVIDRFGWKMTEEQLDSIQYHYPIRAAGYPISGWQNDGSYYDGTKDHNWNTGMPSLAYRQYTSMYDNFLHNGSDIVAWVLGESEDYQDMGSATMLRVTQAYWKSQMKVGHLTKITENGETITDIVSEDYKITDKPIYNTQLFKNKTSRNLVFGEHIEWIWINQVWGGIKIGPNHPSFWGVKNPHGINPIYLGINQNKIKPLKFQFKGDNNLYGCKLPVEGRVFSDRNTRSTSLVDKMKPFQIGFNMVNNQITDILVDEIGTVIMLDQNALPKHSLGEDWGKGNYAKAYVAMKDYSVLPIDGSISNMENASQFSHFQQLDMSQTQRLMGRVQLAGYFKQECFGVVGVVPQRMGQQIGQYDTATGIEQAVSGSYAQTEMYFVQHSDHLMPRVHQMRTDLAQFYHSTKPSVRLQHMTSLDERVNFEINGTDLLGRDINVFATAKTNQRKLMEDIKKFAAEMGSKTGGQTLYDIANIMQIDSLGTLDAKLKDMEQKAEKKAQDQMAHEQELKRMETESREREKALSLDHEAREKEKDRRKDVLVAEIRASGFGAMQDINQNQQSDFLDAMQDIKASAEFNETINLQKDKENNRRSSDREKSNLKREEMNLRRELKDKDVAIAKENRNRFDVPKKTQKKGE